MQYDMLPTATVERLWEIFQGHKQCVNEAYRAVRADKEQTESDRDRFVVRFFKKYIGKYFVMMDKTEYGQQYTSKDRLTAYFSYCSTPCSVYSTKYRRSYPPSGEYASEPVFNRRKTFLRISGFEAVNELYGVGYIKMACFDIFGNRVAIKLDHNNLLYLQFKEITKMEFDYMARMFADDRDDRPYRVMRYIVQETVGKHGNKQTIIKETVEAHAKDEDDARSRYTNVLSVERVE